MNAAQAAQTVRPRTNNTAPVRFWAGHIHTKRVCQVHPYSCRTTLVAHFGTHKVVNSLLWSRRAAGSPRRGNLFYFEMMFE